MSFARSITLRQLDTFQTVVADDTTPNRVVQVENQGLPALSTNGGNGSSHMVGIERDSVRQRTRTLPNSTGGYCASQQDPRFPETSHNYQSIARD